MPVRLDPYLGFRFLVTIVSVIEGGCNEISGLEATTEVDEIREGGVNNFIHKLPKETRFNNLVLKKGVADFDRLWLWHRAVVSGRILRLPVIITMLADHAGRPARLWSFRDAFPIKWTGPQLKADSNTVAFESIEIAHHGYLP